MHNASSFIKNRKQGITNDRIKHILWYVAECYNIMQKSLPRVSYSKSFVSTNTTHKFEDFLKFKFVDDYLIPNKLILQKKVSSLEEVTFSSETQKTYIDSNDGKEKPDKIDIYINKIGLQNEWKEPDEHVYFAIECKRITGIKSYAKYLGDIQKMAERNHTNLRLPFEGMIGFVEDNKITNTIASNEILKKLKSSKTISTTQYLVSTVINTSFEGSYISIHAKMFGEKSLFTLYHLFLDYSANVVD